ncbi:initiation control protein YabA [Desulfotruncus arcticus]|uniref:initiation control protein YabA n=1 Tax=Desulfotruncus arcticus TaxID=341036 RepID=UPI000B898A9D|nr:initiation control protein YabA [Desulfotruncus arcticus]
MKALETKAQDLLNEIKGMKSLVETLETENEKLRRQLALLYGVNEPEDAGNAGTISPGREKVTGRQNLLNLYDAGFHVCNLYFGQSRFEGCLFCAAFLRKDQE